jgi:hypothetical protein
MVEAAGLSSRLIEAYHGFWTLYFEEQFGNWLSELGFRLMRWLDYPLTRVRARQRLPRAGGEARVKWPPHHRRAQVAKLLVVLAAEVAMAPPLLAVTLLLGRAPEPLLALQNHFKRRALWWIHPEAHRGPPQP